MASLASTKLLQDFLAIHPLVPSPLTQVDAKQIDAFWEVHYQHGLTPAELANDDSRARVRNTVIGKLNAAGRSTKWAASGLGLKLVLTQRHPSVWKVMPADVAASQVTRDLADRNKKTIENRALDIIKTTNAANKRNQNRDERKSMKLKKDLVYRNGQTHMALEDKSARAVAQIESNLEQKRPNSPLLEKNTY